jgi:hypothetical protein
MRDSFVFYRSFYEAIKELPRDVQGEVYTCIMEYALNGITTENLKPIARSIFLLVRPQLDTNYKRFMNGNKGGRPNQTETKAEPNNNQTETKAEPNLNDNVNDNDLNKESSSEDSMSDCKPSDPPPPPSAPSPPIGFEKLIRWFNETTGGVFGSVRLPLGEIRKKSLRARISERGEESFYEVVNNAMSSNFLRGQNNRGWVATFDWLIKPSNYDKVLSNNYKNKENGTNQRNGAASDGGLDADFAANIAAGIARSKANKANRQ